MEKTFGIIFMVLIILIISCTPSSEQRLNKQIEIPLFEREKIDQDVIYISHPGLNNRVPTLIKMMEGYSKVKDSIIFLENSRFQSGSIKTSFSRSFEFNSKFNSFPSINIEPLIIKAENRNSINRETYFFVIPGYNVQLFLDSSNIKTETGKKVLEWLKDNVSNISIFERINIWRLENSKEPSEEVIKRFKELNYILDETIDLNRKF